MVRAYRQRPGWGKRWPLLRPALLFLEALAWLALSPLLLRLFPFRRLLPLLGRPERETGDRLTARQRQGARRVQRALEWGSRHSPWPPSCLTRSFTTAMLLRRRHIPYTFYLGARVTPAGLQGHAWVRSGPFLLTGARGESHFTVVATFASDPYSGEVAEDG